MSDKHAIRPGDGNTYSLLEVTDNLKGLQELESTKGTYRLPPQVKPCILKLLSNEGPLQTLENWKVPCIIACELKRVGFPRNKIEKRLGRWEKATPSEVRSAVRVAFEKEYEFGCPKLEALGICLYHTRYECPWFSQIKRKSQATYRERDFYRFG